MPTIQASGTQTPTLNVEETLADLTSPAGVYQLYVDVNAMQAGDASALKIYTKVLSGGELGSIAYQALSGAPTGQGDQIWVSAPFFSDQEIKCTLEQTAGTPRAYPWKLVTFP